MIICRTPFRVSFFGGGTDMPNWINENNKGEVISTTINKYGYIYLRTLDKNYKYNFNIRYYLNEKINFVKEIKHPVVKKCFELYQFNKNLNKCVHLTYDGDLPSRTGLGSSSSFSLGLIHSIFKHKNKKLSKYELAQKTINFEQTILKESVGSQDQVAAAYGGFNHIIFKKKKIFVNSIKPFLWKKKLLNDCLMICLIGNERFAKNLEGIKNRKFKDNLNIYKEISAITNEALNLIKSKEEKSIKKFGQLVNDYWNLKRKLSTEVSNEKIDYYVNKFKNVGAYGCKLMGAGSSGFVLVIANKSVKMKIKKKFSNLKFIDIKAEYEGSKIVKL